MSCMRQTKLTQSGAPGCVIRGSDFSWEHTMILYYVLFPNNFFLWMCHFDSMVSTEVELDIQAFD